MKSTRCPQRILPWPRAFLALVLGLEVLLQLLPARAARAALGDDVAVLAAEQARPEANLQIWRKGNYAIHELAVSTGGKVRHFVGDSGKVFAVSWSGGWRPNLRDIMGVHYDKFIAATRGKRVARGVARIELPGMVVVMGGHQRAFWGHVSLTNLVPEGFTFADDGQGHHD